ncbi:TlpA disulfide reductase family protein [soil metagenome]
MKYIKLLSVVAVSAMVITCSPSKKDEAKGWDIVVKGKVGFPQEGNLILTEIRQDTLKPVEDTIHVKGNYTFQKKIHLTEPGYYRLSFYGRQFVNVILDTTDVEINADGNDPSGFSEIKGSPDIDMIMEVQKYVQESQSSPEMQTLMADFQEATVKQDDKKIKELQAKYQEIIDKSYDKIAELIDKQPASLGLVNLLQNNSPLDKDKYSAVYNRAAAKFTGRWATNFYGKGFVDYVRNIQRTAVGQPAPEISLPDPDGKIITLSSFKGKFVLVDFWAKWCGPCRQENPNVVNAYNEFKSRGFDILSVSLDRTKEDWVKAIQEDGLVWSQVSDLKYFESQAAKEYNINAIPFSILVDPNGIIIAKNLRGATLQKKLAEVLNK